MNRLFGRSRLIGAAVSAGLFLALAWLLERVRMLVYDDAFIHLRIARNLALTGKAFWNPGERVMATSSPVWTILLTVSGLWKHRGLLPWLEAFLVTICAVLAFFVARAVRGQESPDGGSRRYVLPLLAGLFTIVLLMNSAYAQMESPLAIGLLLAAAYSFLRGSRWGLVWLAFAAMTRLEMMVLLGLALLFAVVLRKILDASIAAVLVVSGFAGFLLWQFGVLLPNSMHAKSIGYGLRRSNAFEQFFPPRLTGHVFLICLGYFLLGIVLDRMSARRRAVRDDDGRWLPAALFAWGVIVLVEYTVQASMMFDWYLPLIYVPLALGLLLYRPAEHAPQWMRWSLSVASAFCLATILMPPVRNLIKLSAPVVLGTPEAVAAFDGLAGFRVQQYLELGATLHATCPGGTVMSPEIGALGFGFEGHVDDAFGIASPQAMAFQPLRSGAVLGGIPAGYVQAVLPDVIVSHDFHDSEVTGDVDLMKRYRLISLPTTMHPGAARDEPGWMRSRRLDVFLLRGGQCDTDAVSSGLGLRQQR